MVLAALLDAYRTEPPSNLVVLGLARGGVPVGSMIATALGAPLDVFVVRKLGAPRWPELAMGAIAGGGGVVINDRVVRSLRVSTAQLDAVIDAERVELARRETLYRGGRPGPVLRSKTVVVVDDGIATGSTMLAAVRAVRTEGPARIVVAAPVGPRSVYDGLRDEADDVVLAVVPERFEAVGQVYVDFHQVSDREVRDCLQGLDRPDHEKR